MNSSNPFNLENPSKPFVIAEIGNNHQGDIKIAFEMIKAAKLAGADAVKLQKRENSVLYTPDFYNTPYENENSFGETYGIHRDYVELSIEEIKELKEYSESIDIKLFATPFDKTSLEKLESINMPFYKVASADIVNTPLLNEISKTGKGVIISTGHATYEDIDRALEIFSGKNKIAILHCTAAYPAPIETLNLNCIPKLISRYPKTPIGLSDHENGIDAASIAYMLGARVFEKHFTLNRAEKGTDNAFSLEPVGLTKLVRNLHRIPLMLGSNVKSPLEVEEKPVIKMRKSIVYSRNLNKGSIINKDSFEYRSPGYGLPPYLNTDFYGKKLTKDVIKYDFVEQSDFD